MATNVTRYFSSLLHPVAEWLDSFVSTCIGSLPGAHFALDYIRASYQNDPFRVALEVLLVFFAIRYLLAARYDAKSRSKLTLSDSEVDALLDDWSPAPLVPLSRETPRELLTVPYVTVTDSLSASSLSTSAPPAASHLILNFSHNANSYAKAYNNNHHNKKINESSAPPPAPTGTRELLDLASYDYFGFSQHKNIKNTALAALRTYGVGSCGPPGFYGFADVHQKLEKDIAAYLRTEGAALYAQAFSASSSVIAAFAKRGDTLYVDEEVSLAVLKGVQISRARVIFFKHNDTKDLESKIIEAQSPTSASKQLQQKTKNNRQFIVFEGLYERSGTIAPLPKMIEIGLTYCVRLLMDDTHGFGVLGANGRGTAEHYRIPPGSIDITVGSLAHAVASCGGFCVGSSAAIVENQRLNASAYCFSAAMSPVMAATASHAIRIIQEQSPSLIMRLRENTLVLRQTLRDSAPFLRLPSDVCSPMQHIYIEMPQPLSSRGSGRSHGTCTDTDTDIDANANADRACRTRRYAASAFADKVCECTCTCTCACECECGYCRGGGASRDRATRLLNSVTSGCAWFTAEAEFLQLVVDEAARLGLLVSRAKYIIEEELVAPRPSIRVNVPATISALEMKDASERLAKAFNTVWDTCGCDSASV